MISLSRVMQKAENNFGSVRDVWLLIEIILLIVALPVLMKILSFPCLMNLLTPRSPRIEGDLDRLREKAVKFTDYLLNRTSAMHRRNRCLKRSLVLYHFLNRFGLKIHLCLGVARGSRSNRGAGAGRLEGHAWLLRNGSIFLEENIEITKRYRVTYCFPETAEPITSALI
jgi:hypothetical protein